MKLVQHTAEMLSEYKIIANLPLMLKSQRVSLDDEKRVRLKPLLDEIFSLEVLELEGLQVSYFSQQKF